MKKLIFLLLTASLVAFSGLNVFALELNLDNDGRKTMESVRGSVVSVEPSAEPQSSGDAAGEAPGYKVQIEYGESMLCTFVIDGDSYNAAETDPASLKPGDSFTGWYDPMTASIMIYPPQHYAVVYAANMENGIAAVDVFNFKPDGNMLSRGGDLVLNMETNANADGTPIYGPEVDGKLLVVYSDVIMESFPAQTIPDKIAALDYEPYTVQTDGAESGFYVNGVRVDAPTGYVVDSAEINAPMYYGNEHSDMMIPLRPVAEAMGYEVHWEEEMRAVILNNNVTVSIGSKDYSVARMAPISLDSAAEIIDGRTYVPHTFFTEILNAKVDISESGETWRVDISLNKD